jgi:hypothetical protein
MDNFASPKMARSSFKEPSMIVGISWTCKITPACKPNKQQHPKENKMTQNQFAALCEELTIDPAIALENENVVEALKEKDDEAVERILKEEF